MGGPTPGTDFGGRLKRAREARGVSLRQIATDTKISIGVLEGLERGDISKLPGGIFSRAFVRSYAQQVGLDAEATVREFLEVFPDETIAAGSPLEVARYTQAEEQLFATRQRAARTVLWLVAVTVPLGALVLYLSIGRGQPAIAPVEAGPSTSEAATPTPTEVAASPEAAAPTEVTASPGVAVSPAQQQATPVSEIPQAVAPAEVPAAAPATTDVVTPPTTEAPVREAPPALPAVRSGPPEEAASAGGEQPDRAEATPASTDATTPVPVTPFRIEIEPTSSCWVSLTVDGGLVIARVMQPGERVVRRVESEAVLQVGDAAAFSFALNGRPGRPLGGAGEVKLLRITPANYESFLR